MDILKIFYDQIINEAAIGNVNCIFRFNILFETNIPNMNIKTTYNGDLNVLVPCLQIKNVDEFNNLLLTYVSKSLEFYHEDSILEDIKDKEMIIKTLLTLLWSNATSEDFNDPCEYIKRKIKAFDDQIIKKFDNISYSSSILNGSINLKVNKCSIVNETPYCISGVIKDNDSDNSYILPNVYMEIVDNKAYLYAIQNSKKIDNNNPYGKKVNRKLYGINDGFDSRVDNEELFDSGNLKDVSMNFVLMANIITSILSNNKIDEVVVPSILYERWNAKEITNDLKKINDSDDHERIQQNLTEKLIRTFRRLASAKAGLVVTSYPYELDSNLHLNLIANLKSENELLMDTSINKERTIGL